MGERRVVVTGRGAVTPLGNSVSSLWDGLIAGRSAVRTVKRFDASQFDVRFGGECVDFTPETVLDVRQIKRMDRFSQLAYVAAQEAFKECGLTPGSVDPQRIGVVIGSGIGGIGELEEQHKRLIDKGPSRVSAFTIPKLMTNAASGHISIAFNAQGVNTAVATACASAGNAIGDSFHAIRFNQADVMITGGSEAALSPLGLAAFAAMKALSVRNDDPAVASRPWDKDRDGFVLSEGAGILVLEEYEHARRRGAPILAELIGYGATADAGDMVQPDPEGRGAGRAISLALACAGIDADQVDYINAHATSTPLGDVAETRAIKRVFGAAARKLTINSTKSAIGHTLGASGGIEALVCVDTLRHNTVHPTINLDEPDAECDLDFVPKHARDARVNIAMSNSFGFGGHNACLIFRKI